MINFLWFSVSVYVHQSLLGYIWPILGVYRIWFSGALVNAMIPQDIQSDVD